MGCPTKVQLIDRQNSQQWYVNFPAAIAQAMQFQRGETVEWLIEDKQFLILKRREVPPAPVVIKKRATR
jgi:antitoxin component of MazEF toxin-antitoxin module